MIPLPTGSAAPGCSSAGQVWPRPSVPVANQAVLGLIPFVTEVIQGIRDGIVKGSHGVTPAFRRGRPPR